MDALEREKKLYQKIMEPIKMMAKIKALMSIEDRILAPIKRLSEIEASFLAYSEVVEEVCEIYNDPDKRKSYLDEIITHCPETFSTYPTLKENYVDYILLLTTQKLLAIPLGYLPKDPKKLFDIIKKYVIKRVTNFMRGLDYIPLTEDANISWESLETRGDEGDVIGEYTIEASKPLWETFLKREKERKEFLEKLEATIETLPRYMGYAPPEDRKGWLRYMWGATKKDAFGDRRREDRATKRIQRKMSKEEYQVFSLSLRLARDTIADAKAMVEIGIIEKELLIAILKKQGKF